MFAGVSLLDPQPCPRARIGTKTNEERAQLFLVYSRRKHALYGVAIHKRRKRYLPAVLLQVHPVTKRTVKV
jgi:hypothetical protein